MSRSLAVTMGDANGVGPEILLRFFETGGFPTSAIVYGDLAVLQKGAQILGLDIEFNVVDSSLRTKTDHLNVVDFGLLSEQDLQPGNYQRERVQPLINMFSQQHKMLLWAKSKDS